MSWLGLILAAVALALFLIAARYAFFAALALLQPAAPPPARLPMTKFCVVIPAHNEAAGVTRTIDAARKMDYPTELFRVLVAADNCEDETAARARQAGAGTVERTDAILTGKGELIHWVMKNHMRPDEALVICDADSLPARDYLSWMNHALASGYGAAQGYNGAANPEDSSLAMLSALTGGMKNRLQYAGKLSAGLPAPLMNGLTLAAVTWQMHPWQAFSIAEDFETYLRLADAGVPMRYVPEAKILSNKARSFKAASGQRRRWSGGQSRLAWRVAWPMAIRALKERSLVKFEAALDLLLPGYATCTGLLFIVVIIGALLCSDGSHPAVGLALTGLLLMLGQFIAGLFFIHWTRKTFTALLLAPFYILWKLFLALQALFRGPEEWHRADRG